jgi:uncharacterized protein involved in outer membrane biogenesis
VHDLTGNVSLGQIGDDQRENGRITISSCRYHNLPIKDASADLLLIASSSDLISVLSNGKATAGGGDIIMSGSYDWTSHRLTAKGTATRVKAAVIADELFAHPGEISGVADANIDVSTDCDNYNSAISNLSGQGQVTLRSGNISRFGQLQAKITQANLLRQGLFGFNLNNLLQSVYPVRTGQFHDLTGKFNIDKGVITVGEIRYNGDDMRLWGNGKANLTLDTLSIEIAGKIPRVTTSVIGGPVGEMSRALTFQKVMDVVTLHQLEALPSLPVFGEFASDNKPRTFGFKVVAPLDNPKMLAQSIEKSFHWLAPKPAASAHPVPGLQ